MWADTLAKYGLQGDDTIVASDHLPVVADFVLPVSVAAPQIIAGVRPDPAKKRLWIVFTEQAARSRKVLTFYDTRGRKVSRAESPPGETFCDWAALEMLPAEPLEAESIGWR
jgi:hypothetical protein